MVFRASQKGFSLVGVLVASAVMATVATAFLSMFKSQTKASRHIASQGGVTDLSHGLDLLFGDHQCATTGTYLQGGSPASVTIAGATYSTAIDTLKFQSGALALTSLPDKSFTQSIQPNVIAAVNFQPVGSEGTDGTGFVYPFKLTVNFSSTGGPPALPLTKFVKVFTDATRKVVGICDPVSGSKAAFQSVHVQSPQICGNTSGTVSCPAGYALSGCTSELLWWGGAGHTLDEGGGNAPDDVIPDTTHQSCFLAVGGDARLSCFVVHGICLKINSW